MAARNLAIRLARTALTGLVLSVAALNGGCEESRFDDSGLYEGMDRSTIIARFGSPDTRKSHDNAERLTYKDGEYYQYLLMLIDGKLIYWQHDRMYQAGRFSSIGNRSEDPE